jgi:transposase
MDKIEAWGNLGLFIIYLPTYSPHLNPTEILWRRMKYNWLKPKDYLNKEALHSAINHSLENYSNDDFTIDFKADFNC